MFVPPMDNTTEIDVRSCNDSLESIKRCQDDKMTTLTFYLNSCLFLF